MLSRRLGPQPTPDRISLPKGPTVAGEKSSWAEWAWMGVATPPFLTPHWQVSSPAGKSWVPSLGHENRGWRKPPGEVEPLTQSELRLVDQLWAWATF